MAIFSTNNRSLPVSSFALEIFFSVNSECHSRMKNTCLAAPSVMITVLRIDIIALKVGEICVASTRQTPVCLKHHANGSVYITIPWKRTNTNSHIVLIIHLWIVKDTFKCYIWPFYHFTLWLSITRNSEVKFKLLIPHSISMYIKELYSNKQSQNTSFKL